MAGLVQAPSKLQHSVLISIVVILLLMVGCSSPSVQQKPGLDQRETHAEIRFRSKPETAPQYPAWFWHMPSSESSLFAVGRSTTSALHPETSQQKAIENGVENLVRALSVRIKGEYAMERHGARTDSDHNIQEEVSPAMRSLVEKRHKMVATFAVPEHTLVLLRLGEEGAAVPISSAASAAVPNEPGWVTVPPKEPGYLYASGQSNPYYREVNSWRSAEEHARRQLALILEANVRGLAKGQRMAVGRSNITISTDVQLSRAQVVARWKHPEHQACHVLVRMPLLANTEAITDLVKSVLTDEEPQEKTPQKSQEEIIQEVFDELDRLTAPKE